MKFVVPIALVAFVVGALLGVAVDRRRGRTPDAGTGSSAASPAAKSKVAPGGDDEVQRLREETRTLREQLAAVRAGARQPLSSVDEAKKNAAELRKKIAGLLEAKDGKALCSLMRELASLGEPGYEGALEIAELLKKDVLGPKGHGEGAENLLGLSTEDFFKLWSGRMVPMLAWSLGNPGLAPSWFRTAGLTALYYNGDLDGPRLFAETLRGEKDPEVAAYLAGYLRTAPPDLSPLLVESAHFQRDNVEALLGITLALGQLGTPESVVAIEELRGHPDESVRLAAEMEMKAIRPPVAGAFITQFGNMDSDLPAPLKRGDIVVSWNGSPVGSWEEFEKNALAAATDGTVSLVIHRGNELVTVEVKGRLRDYDGKYVAPGK